MIIKLIIPLFLCFFPIILAFFILKKLNIKTSSLIIAFLLGLFSILPISIIQMLADKIPFVSTHPVIYQITKSIILIGFVEELCKMALQFFIPKKEITLFSFLMLSFMFGLTLGCFESAAYYLNIFTSSLTNHSELLYSLIALRFVSSDLIHLSCAGLGGLFVYSCYLKKPKISFFIIAVLIHGLFDFFAPLRNNLKYFAIPVILLALLECRIKYMTLKTLQENA